MRSARKTVLVVDDEAIIALDTAERLERHGYAVETVHDGEAAVRTATADTSVDLVLMDIDLGSGMDGTEAAAQILAARELPIVFLTSHSEQEMVRRVRDITRYGYIIKGTGDFVLVSSIEMALDLFDAHRRARLGEERYRTLVESIREIIYEIDSEGTILFMSPAVKNIFGYEPDWLVGRKAAEFVHPDDLELLRTRIPLAGAAGPSVYRFRSASGEYRWVRTHTRRVAGSSDRALGALVDINELKLTEKALEQSEERQERAELIARVGNWEFDLESRTVYASRGARELYGIGAREWTIEEVQTVPLKQYRPVLDRALSDLIAGRAPYDVEFKIRRPSDGRIVDIHSIAEFDAQRNLVFGVIQDVTQQNRVQKVLHESLDYLHAVLDSVNDALFVDDAATGRIIDVNETACTMYGYSRDEMLQLDVEALSAGDPPYTQADALGWMERSRAGEPQIFNWTAKHKSGKLFPVEVNIRYAVIGTDERFIVTVRDISGRIESEREIGVLLEEKEMILREVHHRIKNNISVIASLLSLQAVRVSDAEARAAIEEAERRVRTIGTLYEKLYRSNEFQYVDAREYFSDLIRDIFRAAGGGEAGIAFEVDIESFPVSARACVPIGLILNELLTNAVKHAFTPVGPAGSGGGDSGAADFTPVGSSRASSDPEHGTPKPAGTAQHHSGRNVSTRISTDGAAISIRLADDGRGLPAPLEEVRGMGLGLTIVSALLRQLSGKMEAESRPGEGTSFLLRLTDPAPRYGDERR